MSWQDSVIGALSTLALDGGYTVTRQANAGFDPATGDPLAGTVTTFSLTDATVQPSSGRGLVDVLVEGRHTNDTIEIITSTELYVSTIDSIADRVLYLGIVYEVIKVSGPFRHAAGTHYEVSAARLTAP